MVGTIRIPSFGMHVANDNIMTSLIICVWKNSTARVACEFGEVSGYVCGVESKYSDINRILLEMNC